MILLIHTSTSPSLHALSMYRLNSSPLLYHSTLKHRTHTSESPVVSNPPHKRFEPTPAHGILMPPLCPHKAPKYFSHGTVAWSMYMRMTHSLTSRCANRLVTSGESRGGGGVTLRTTTGVCLPERCHKCGTQQCPHPSWCTSSVGLHLFHSRHRVATASKPQETVRGL